MIAAHFIDGRIVAEGDVGESFNPADQTKLGDFYCGSAQLVDQAASRARAAFFELEWAYNPRLRAQVLMELAAQLELEKESIADLIVLENGKLRKEAIGETNAAISELRYYAGLARNIRGSTQEVLPGQLSLLHREPAGVAGIIVPWNAPLTLLARSLAPALAAGCTCIVKPALQTPLVHAKIMECIHKSPSLPKGVIHSVNENGIEVGKAMVASPHIDVISFTGSSRTGKSIMEGAASTLKRVGLELGGKAPSIIFEDADIDLAVTELTNGSLNMAGQICVAAARFIVHSSIADNFRDRMVAAYKNVKVGPGNNPASMMGSLIDIENQNRLKRIIEQAGDEGTMILRGGWDGDGAFLTPTLFGIDDTASSLVQDELFGPIVSLERFEDEAEAVAKANATSYGLAASVFTRDGSRALRISRSIRSGTVWINSHLRLFAEVETGGFGNSGLGRLHGPEGLADFLETKHIYIEQGRV